MASRPEGKPHVKGGQGAEENVFKGVELGYWRKLFNDDFHGLHLSPNFKRIITGFIYNTVKHDAVFLVVF